MMFVCTRIRKSHSYSRKMAATVAVEEAAITTDNWSQEDHLMGSAESEKAANGASSAVSMEERTAAQDPEPQDYPRSSSAGAIETFRERQVKVLRSFLSVFACSFGALPSVPHSQAGLHASLSVNIS